jgi:hypothetical protein
MVATTRDERGVVVRFFRTVYAIDMLPAVPMTTLITNNASRPAWITHPGQKSRSVKKARYFTGLRAYDAEDAAMRARDVLRIT